MNFFTGSQLFTAIASLLLGIFVYFQGRRRTPNIALAIFSLALSGWCFGQFMGGVLVAKEAVLFWTRFNIGCAIFLPALYLYFILAFIGGTAKSRLNLVLAFGLAGILFLLDLTPLFVSDVAPRPGYPYYPVPGLIYPFFAVYLFIVFGLSFLKLLIFMIGSAGAQKNQAKYVLAASLIGFLGGATAFFPVFNIDLPVVSHWSMPIYLAITVYAIVKHQLLDISLVIREGLVYSTLTVLFAGFYAAAILSANYFFRNLTSLNEMVATVIVVFVSVLVFQPLRNYIQQAIDRLFFRGSYYYQKTIESLSAENLKLYRSLLQADKLAALGTIAAGMAHEIKNPLASIKGLTQVLPENLGDSDFIRKYSEIVPRQLDRINRIVEDLLDFGHPKEMDIKEIKVTEVINGVLKLLENQCRQAGIEMITECGELPALYADEEKLSQAFMNIVLNAVQALPAGGQIRLKVYKDGELVRVEVNDNGQGIPEEKLPNIFDPFYTTKETGSGMGLAVTYRIIKEHGGEIEVDSAVGKGTTFTICLPIRRKQ